MKNRVRWGLLSTANINRRVIPAIRQSMRGTLDAVASRSQAAADAYAAQWEIARAYGSYEALLAADDIDALYIALPNHLHAEWTIKALEAGKHVLCEKPFALTLAEVDAMIAAATRSGLVLAEAFMYRHHPQTKLIKTWIRDGRLGELVSVTASFNFQMGRRDNIRLVPQYGGGCLWDVGIYPVSLAQYIFEGPPVAVSGMQWLGTSGVDEHFVGLLQYANGGLARIEASFRAAFEQSAVIHGTEGRLVINRPFTGFNGEMDGMFYYDSRDNAEAIKTPPAYLYLGEVEDMHAAILDGAPQYVTLAETRDHVRSVLALYESAHSAARVHLLPANGDEGTA